MTDDRRIRVVRVIARLNIGGPALHVVLLTAGLNPARFTTTLVAGTVSRHEGDMSYFAEAAGVQPVVLPELGRDLTLVADLVAFVRLWRLMRRVRPHVVHTHTAKAGAVGRIAARLAGVPVVVHTFHGHVFRGYFGRWQSWLAVQTERALSRLSDCIVTVSDRLRDDIIVNYRVARAEQVEVVPLGLDLSPYLACESLRGQFRRELGLDGAEAALVGAVGRLTAIKNHRLFLQAARVVLESGQRAHFVIVGDGELRETLKEEAQRMGMSQTVSFTGWRRDLPAVYADLDVVVNSSLNEGTPLALIEAMAAGRPVVATAVGGVSDLVHDGTTGWLTPSGDARALARAIGDALSDRASARARAEAAQASIRSRCSADGLIRNVETLYERLLTAKGIH